MKPFKWWSFAALLSLAWLQPTWSQVPEVTPRDVYPAVKGIVSDLQAVRTHRFIHTPIEFVPLNPGHTPRDCYQRAYHLLERSRTRVLALGLPAERLNPLPERLDDRPVPADVLDIITAVQAEIALLKQLTDTGTATPSFPPEAGATPPQVCQLIGRALALLETL